MRTTRAQQLPADPVTVGSLASGQVPRSSAELSRAPYWTLDAPLQAAAPARVLPRQCDVVVVGAGYTGLSAALTLARRGRDVLVLDALEPGAGASTRNGGQIGSGNQKFRVRRLIEIHGERKALELLREGVAMLDYIEQVIREERIECHFVRCGRFRGAIHGNHYDAMARDMEDLRRFTGVESFMVPKLSQHTEIVTTLFHGGSVLPQDASLHPGLYHAGLLRRAEEAGALVVGGKAVGAIRPSGSGFEVETSSGKVHCRNVVMATNGYTGDASPYLRRRIVPVGSAQITTGELTDALLSTLMPGGRMYGNTNRVFFYFRRVPGTSRIMAGGRLGRNVPDSLDRFYAHLGRELLSVFPSLADAQLTHAWHGRIGYTFDELPHLGRTPDGIHFAMGYCGTGVSRSTYFGHKIALQLLGDPAGRTAFDDLIFPSHPFHFVARAAVPVYETWYRLRDTFNR